MSELVFYTHPKSRGRIVRWMLEEVGQPYRTEIVSYGAVMKRDAFLALNPMGKIPVLEHGGAVVTECAAICAYLADAFPGSKLAPSPASAERAAYYRWLFFAAGPLEAAVTNKALNVEVPPERRGMVGYGSLADVLATIEHLLDANTYVAGDAFSAADLYLGSGLMWGMMFGTVEKRPAFSAYCDRLRQRSAYNKAAELDDAAAAAIA